MVRKSELHGRTLSERKVHKTLFIPTKVPYKGWYVDANAPWDATDSTDENAEPGKVDDRQNPPMGYSMTTFRMYRDPPKNAAQVLVAAS